ncbi:hypothetical protein EW026_g5620 [Hermanssonia centrifuga]|uniref:Uncharacterized protein n=1 Tax=Hermanssonia centrifuga TaxID=98765 RepID=A0A4S4KDI7_9APHY|nr:hypothetical protein EW026_g5620 [Hermanssonia centrifuga]
MMLHTMKARTPVRLTFIRSYATRLPERPPYRAPDPLVNNPNAVYEELPGDLTFIHRPPPSAASPESYTTSPASPLVMPVKTPAGATLPPSVRKEKPAPPRMSDEDLARMRELRAKNPRYWTAGKLAKELNCSQLFVRMMAGLKNSEKKAALKKRDEEHQRFRSQWGEKRVMNQEIRMKRQQYW